jgi:spore germination protein GerM
VTSRLVGAAALLLLLAGGCGVPEDDRPQALAREDLPPDLLDPDPSAETSLPESGPTVVVYFLQETPNGVRLAEVERRVADARTPDDRLAALFAGLDADEPDAGLSTQIPADTVLRDVDTNPEADEVIIDVSGDLLSSIEGRFLSQAFAQIVWTATEPSAGGYTNVRFLVDGVPQSVIDGDGVEQEGSVDRADYSSFSPPR